MAGMQLRICDSNGWVEETDAGAEITRYLPSWTAFRKDQSMSTRGRQSQRTLGSVVWQGWAGP